MSPTSEIGIAFKVPSDLHERFKAAAEAEHRPMKSALINLMEQRVAEHEASRKSALEAAVR